MAVYPALFLAFFLHFHGTVFYLDDPISGLFSNLNFPKDFETFLDIGPIVEDVLWNSGEKFY